jgi:hypothetical protein
MPNLKLRTFDDQTEPEVLKFPRIDPRGSGVELLHDEDVSEPFDALDLASRIEHTLEQLQHRLDRVKNELEGVYRFPEPSDWTRPAA